jgi:hypothetical protein
VFRHDPVGLLKRDGMSAPMVNDGDAKTALVGRQTDDPILIPSLIAERCGQILAISGMT